MFVEEPLDVFGGNRQFSLLLEKGGELLEAQRGIFDMLDQYPDGCLCTQRTRRVGTLTQESLLALLAVLLCFLGQVTKLARDFNPIQLTVLMQIGRASG